jgi:hypothetical protein
MVVSAKQALQHQMEVWLPDDFVKIIYILGLIPEDNNVFL